MRTFDNYGNELHGLQGEGDPTIATSYAEIIGAIPQPEFGWTARPFFPFFGPDVTFRPGVMTREAQTLSPYIIGLGPNNQPQVSAWDTFGAGVNDMGIAVENAQAEISANAQKIGEGLFSVGKWLVVGIVGMAVLEAVKAAPKPARRSRRNR